MNELVFRVAFKSDIVLPATSNTEGNIESLEFIPGSNFLGMAAAEYEKYENSFDVFHSGHVMFGDATIMCHEKQTYKMPLSYFHEKNNKEKMYNHHLIDDFSQFSQLKQLREGFITSTKDVTFIHYNYSQKSAYDKKLRRSKESSMFGYNAIKSDTLWQFTLKYDDSISKNDLERIKKNLLGTKRLGKSKSAQYGAVEISLEGKNEEVQNLVLSKEVVLYANSRLSLVDEEGNPTLDLRYLCDGLKESNILYKKTQLKTSTFTPYNGARETKDYERVCINKGSVIVLEEIDKEQLQKLQNGVGAYLSEGFGELLINPSFLNDAMFTFNKDSHSKKNQEKVKVQDATALFLQKRENTQKEKLKLANEVHKFIEENKETYSQKMNSQWGTIRSLCANSQDIYADVEKYITDGVAQEKWKDAKSEKLLNAIKSSDNPLEFTKLLSMQMPKVKDLATKSQEENKDAK